MNDDATIRVPRELQNRFNKLETRKSWRGFPSFSREAVRFFLEYQENLEKKKELRRLIP